MKEALHSEERFSLVGTSPPRVDALEKATGSLRFSADMPLEGALHGALVRSPHPHALIKGIDAGEACRVPGFLELVTAKDVPGLNRWGVFRTDQPVFCEEKVRFVGDVVAMVVAETREAAKEGASRVRVRYELLPPVLDPEEALKPDSHLVHDSGNLLSHCKVRRGNVEEGFREADVIVEGTYYVPFVDHA
ncbi:MAG: xanthine dehydrogenase family protein molybdopterin-binding subunit, partial [Nitrospinota bacterium]